MKHWVEIASGLAGLLSGGALMRYFLSRQLSKLDAAIDTIYIIKTDIAIIKKDVLCLIQDKDLKNELFQRVTKLEFEIDSAKDKIEKIIMKQDRLDEKHSTH